MKAKHLLILLEEHSSGVARSGVSSHPAGGGVLCLMMGVALGYLLLLICLRYE